MVIRLTDEFGEACAATAHTVPQPFLYGAHVVFYFVCLCVLWDLLVSPSVFFNRARLCSPCAGKNIYYYSCIVRAIRVLDRFTSDILRSMYIYLKYII